MRKFANELMKKISSSSLMFASNFSSALISWCRINLYQTIFVFYHEENVFVYASVKNEIKILWIVLRRLFVQLWFLIFFLQAWSLLYRWHWNLSRVSRVHICDLSEYTSSTFKTKKKDDTSFVEQHNDDKRSLRQRSFARYTRTRYFDD